MSEYRSVLERAHVELRPLFTFRSSASSEAETAVAGKRRIAAGVVGIAVFVAAVWIVTSLGSLNRLATPAVPGPAEAGTALPNCAVTRCTETGPVPPTPTRRESPPPRPPAT